MPIVCLQLTEGFQPKQKTELLRAASQAVEDTLVTPRATIRVLLTELPAEHLMYDGEIGVPLLQCQVFLIAGRSPELKAALIAALNKSARQILGLGVKQVRVLLSDVPSTDMGMDDGVTAQALGR